MKKLSPFRYFKTSPEVIRLAVMMYVRYRLSLRQVEDLLFERGIDMCRETVRLWWNRLGLLVSYRPRDQVSTTLVLPPCSRSGSKTALQAAHRPACRCSRWTRWK
jgi:hypothetical protein